MTNQEIWPFLISRNRKYDYRAVVAPDFMITQGISDLLSQFAGGDPNQGPVFEHFQDPSGVAIYLAYRVTPALDEQALPLLDGFGRQVFWVEGWVSKKDFPNSVDWDNFFDRAHKQVLPAFMTFWENQISDTVPSYFVDLKASQESSTDESHKAKTIVDTPNQEHRVVRGKRIVQLLLVGLLIGLYCIILFQRNHIQELEEEMKNCFLDTPVHKDKTVCFPKMEDSLRFVRWSEFPFLHQYRSDLN